MNKVAEFINKFITIFTGILSGFSHESSKSNLTNRSSRSGSSTGSAMGSLKLELSSSGKVVRSLAFKIPLTGFFFSLIISSIIGTTFYIESKKLVIEKELQELKTEIKIIEPLIKGFYINSIKDITLMGRIPAAQGIIQAIEQNDKQKLLLWQQRLQAIYFELLKTKPIFKSISYIILDENNRSVVSVRNQQGIVRIIGDGDLAQHIDITSLKSVLSTTDGSVSFSDIEFYDTKSATNNQAQSVVFAGIPIYSNKTNKIRAMVAIEVNFTQFITELKSNALQNVNFYLANSSGKFIFNPEANKEQDTLSFLSKFPDLQSRLETGADFFEINETSVIDGTPQIASYSAVDLSDFGKHQPLHLLIKSHTASYLDAIKSMRLRAFIIAISLAILSLGIAIIASKRLIRPLLQMTNSLYQYEDTGQIGELPISEKDESGVLARSFHNLLIKVENESQQQFIETERAEDATLKLQNILNSIADAVININDKGHIISFNLAAEEMFGYRAAEVINKSINILMPREFSSKYEKYIQDYFQSSEAITNNKGNEFSVMRKDGVIFTIYLSVSEIMTKDGMIFTGLIRDITEQKVLEADKIRGIQEVENMAWRLNFALSAPKIGVWDYNIITGTSTWDERMYTLHELTFSAALIPEAQWLSYIDRDDLIFVKKQLKYAKKYDDDLNFEYRIVLANGAIKYIETHAQVIKDDYGNNIRIVGTNRDITEQHDLLVLQQQALEIAEDALRLRSEFLASMSHEIRTPMNGVLGMLNLLGQSELTKQQRHNLQLAASSGQSLLLLINDILDFSKIEAGKLDLEVLNFDIRSQLGEFAESMAVRAQEKGLELILDVTKIDFYMVKGDPGRLRQILSNLVGNSIKFTDKGEILIKAFINEYDERLQLTCSISDTGIGIPENKVGSLFDSFTQVDASTTRKYGGTGLGLAIVKQLCQLMDGSIDVISSHGHGSEFTFSIFLEKSEQSNQIMPNIDIKDTKILIVDDNLTNLEVLKGHLEIWGAKVNQTQDGFDALEIIAQYEENYFDVAILDMQMPGMNGATLGQRIKEDKRCTKMKLIMMTSMSERGDATYFANLGFSAYFPKPTITADLFDALSVVLEEKQAFSDAVPLVTHQHLKTLKRDTLGNKSIDKKVRILLVEDNRINQVVLLGVLSNLGLSADVAGNGLEALAALMSTPEDAPYQLIIMDCQMPEMDGYEATKAIRSGKTKAFYNNIPIIAMTANAMKGDKEKCLIAGMNDYATKPVDSDALYEKLLYWVGEESNALNLPSTEENITNAPRETKHGFTDELTAFPTNDPINTHAQNEQVENEQVENEQANLSAVVWDKVGFLKRVRNNKNMGIKLIAMFIEDMPQVKDELCEAIINKQLKDITSFAHKLTGTVSNLGGVSLAKLTKGVEVSSINGSIEEIELLVQKIHKEYQLFHDEISNFSVS
ncbi:MAG: two-component system sensor histidine kinase/response regulator [Alteromonadaceae bacterium]|jgi:two-component system sensor histidine kinase/response regulator